MCSGRAPFFLLATWLLLSLSLADEQSAAKAASAAATYQKSEPSQERADTQLVSDIDTNNDSDSSSRSSNSKSVLNHAMFKRGAPRFLGKRQSAPRFLGKRQSAPRFVGKRQSAPRFVGKRQSAPRFVGKRQSAPRFVGKRQSAPRFVGKRQSAPRFVGKRQSAPRFVGKRQRAPRFLGKRQQAPRFLGKRLIDQNIIEFLAPELEDEIYIDPALGKREDNTPFLNAEEFIKTYRKSDPYFMGKRSGYQVDQDSYETSLLNNDFEPEKRGAPRFLGKRGAPRFLGKRDYDTLASVFDDDAFEQDDLDSVDNDVSASWPADDLGSNMKRFDSKGPYFEKLLDSDISEVSSDDQVDIADDQAQR